MPILKSSLTALIFPLLFPTLLLAQNVKPAVDSTSFSYAVFRADSLSSQLNIQPDTMPDNIQYYDPAIQAHNAYATQGNIGKATRNIFPDYFPKTGFNTGISCFDLYRYDPGQIKQYRQYFPFTDIHYVMGAKKEQVFEIVHSQNIGKLFAASASLRIFNSPGGYQWQKSDVTNMIITLQYHSKNQKYKANVNVVQNILKLQENGGITKDSIFENNTEPDRRVIPVNLTAAQNRIRETSLVFYQDYCFLKDSIFIKRPWLKYLPLTLVHHVRYTENSWVYEEPGTTTAFYPFPPQDTNKSQDQLLLHQLINKVMLCNPGQNLFNYCAGITYENIYIRNAALLGNYIQLASYFNVRFTLPYNINLSAYGQKYYGGYNGGDTYSEIKLSKAFGNKEHPFSKLSLWNRTSSLQPSWTQKHYQTNLISWDKDFIRIQTNTLGAEFQFKILELGYRLHTLRNFIINDTLTSIPIQLNNDVNLMQLYAQLRIKIWKIVFEDRLDYQKADHDTYLHLPEIISRHAVYFDFKLFNSAMILQPGIALYWQSAYYADKYMPVTSSFYIQKDIKLKGQFYADAFIEMKVSRASIFLKYQHFNANFGPYNYYQIPHYPIQDAAIRFGFSWLLRDLPDHDKKFTPDAAKPAVN